MFIDTHIDTLWAMKKQNREFYESSDEGHIDLSRAQEANLLAGFFTGYPSNSTYTTEKMMADWVKMVNQPKNMMYQIKSFKDLENLEMQRNGNRMNEMEIGVILSLEGSSGIDTGLNRLYIYYQMGLRSIGLTWNEENQFATGQAQGEHRGLTGEGFDLLSAVEDLGIIIDVSHLNDKSFWDVLNNTNSPVIASHSNVRYLADHRRNLTREMIEAIHSSGGSIGINLCTHFLNDDAEKASMNDAIRMFGEIIKIADIKSVHLGADLDGAPLPRDMKDISSIPELFNNLKLDLNLSNNELNLIKKDNVKRIIKKIWN